jgi:hypothetical protein
VTTANATGSKRLLHLARTTDPPAAALAPGDWVVYDRGGGWILTAAGSPPLAPGPIDAAQLHDLVFAADAAVVW